ncbi:CaiB/BaiF CoA transferase family protein [Sneathiella aquimaris]|uniref:CaiB/BaiF CoA transferase family protein n=1 Tax=Sneathiella aquimaris TaxID=2599305 RepID=UPI00146C9D03|nr:CoA transferase [Sneathiella aquimaris]
MPKPLEDIKIVDLTNMLMGPYTTQILGDMGADVIKVEAPGGDPVRYIGAARNLGMGAIYLNCNRSKRSLVLDLKTEEGHAAILRLIAKADILVYNRRPQVMERLGLSYETVRQINPSLIYAGLYGYGQNGPYAKKPAFDDLIQGAVSIPALAQMADGGAPRYAPSAIVDRGVALWAVGQINAALYYRSRTGTGQKLDLPMFEMMVSFILADHMEGETFLPPIGRPGYKRMLNPDRRPYPTQDGYICAMIYTDRHWRDFYKALGKEDVLEQDPRFTSITTRTEHIAEIYAELAALLQTRTTDEWMTLFDLADVPAMPMNSPESLLGDVHLAQTGFFIEREHPSEGKIRDMAVPAFWSESQPAPTCHAPLLGEHSFDVLSEVGYDREALEKMKASGVIE